MLASGNSFNSRFFAKGDGNWFGAFALNYVHDFENQRGDTFEATLQGYDAQQFSLHQFDIGTLELRAGPRFVLTPGSPYAVSIKPYLDRERLAARRHDLFRRRRRRPDAACHCRQCRARSLCRSGAAELPQFNVLSARQQSERPACRPSACRRRGRSSPGSAGRRAAPLRIPPPAFSPDSYDAFAADFWLPWNFSLLGDGRIWTHHADRGLHATGNTTPPIRRSTRSPRRTPPNGAPASVSTCRSGTRSI